MLVPLFEHVAGIHGWRVGYLAAAVATAALAPLSIVLLTLSRRREQAAAAAAKLAGGQLDQKRGASGTSAGAAADGELTASDTRAAVERSLRQKLLQLAYSRLYWGLTVAFVICGITTTGFIESHLVAFATHHGMSAATGARAFGLLSACNGCGILLAGHLSDRYNRIVLVCSLVIW